MIVPRSVASVRDQFANSGWVGLKMESGIQVDCNSTCAYKWELCDQTWLLLGTLLELFRWGLETKKLRTLTKPPFWTLPQFIVLLMTSWRIESPQTIVLFKELKHPFQMLGRRPDGPFSWLRPLSLPLKSTALLCIDFQPLVQKKGATMPKCLREKFGFGWIDKMMEMSPVSKPFS